MEVHFPPALGAPAKVPETNSARMKHAFRNPAQSGWIYVHQEDGLRGHSNTDSSLAAPKMVFEYTVPGASSREYVDRTAW